MGKKKGKSNGNGVYKVIVLLENAVNGKTYKIARQSEFGYQPDGAPKSARDLYPFVDGKRIRYATSEAKNSLISQASNSRMSRIFKSLETISS